MAVFDRQSLTHPDTLTVVALKVCCLSLPIESQRRQVQALVLPLACLALPWATNSKERIGKTDEMWEVVVLIVLIMIIMIILLIIITRLPASAQVGNKVGGSLYLSLVLYVWN